MIRVAEALDSRVEIKLARRKGSKAGRGPDQYLQYAKISSGLKHFPFGNSRKNLIHFILNWLRMGGKEK